MDKPRCSTSSSLYLSGGGCHETEPVPSVLMLRGAAGSLSGFHVALFPVPKVHQTEVQSRLVNKEHDLNSHLSGQGFTLHVAEVEGSNLGSHSTGSAQSSPYLILLYLLKCKNVLNSQN